jgi:hypothetical protein
LGEVVSLRYAVSSFLSLICVLALGQEPTPNAARPVAQGNAKPHVDADGPRTVNAESPKLRSLECFPSHNWDARYFTDPAVEPFLTQLDTAFNTDIKRITGDVRMGATALGGNVDSRKEYPLSRILDWSIFFAHNGITPIKGLPKETLTEARLAVDEEFSKRQHNDFDMVTEKLDVKESLLSVTERNGADGGKFKVVEWRDLMDEPERLEKLVAKLFAGTGLPAGRPGVQPIREWLQSDKFKEFIRRDFDKLPFYKIALLREFLMQKFEQESELRIAEEKANQAWDFNFRPPLKFSAEDRRKWRNTERLNACAEEQAARELRERNDLVAGYLTRREKPLPRHGLPLEMRSWFQSHTNGAQARVDGVTKDLTKALDGVVHKARPDDDLYGPPFLTELFYRGATEDPVHLWNQRNDIDNEALVREEHKENQNRTLTREQDLARLNYLFKAQGKTLSPTDLENLRLLPSQDFDQVFNAVHGALGVDPSKSLIKQGLSDLLQKIRGQSTGPNNLVGAMVLPTTARRFEVDPSKLRRFELVPPPSPGRVGADGAWAAKQNSRIVAAALTEFESKPDAKSRGGWFEYFDEEFRRAYGETLSHRFCGKAKCDEADAKKPLTDQEKSAIWRFLYAKTLLQKEKGAGPIAAVSPGGSGQVEAERGALRTELKRIQDEAAKCEQTQGAAAAQCRQTENDAHLRRLRATYHRELERARAHLPKKDPQTGVLTPNPQAEKTVKAYQDLIGLIDEYQFEQMSPSSRAKLGIGDTANVTFISKDGGSLFERNIPVKMLYSPNEFRNFMYDRFVDELLMKAYPNDAAKRAHLKTDATPEEIADVNARVFKLEPRPILRTAFPLPEDQVEKMRLTLGYWHWFLKNPRQTRADYSSAPTTNLEEMDSVIDRLWPLDSARKIVIARKPDVTPEVAQRFSNVSSNAFQLQQATPQNVYDVASKLSQGTPAQRQQYADLLTYFDRFPPNNPTRLAVQAPSFPPHLARFANDKQLRDLWNIASPQFKRREHGLYAEGQRTGSETREQLLDILKKATDRSELIEKPEELDDKAKEVKKEEDQKKITTPVKAFVAHVEESVAKAMTDEKVPPLDFKMLEHAMGDDPGRQVRTVERGRAYLLHNLLIAKREREGKPPIGTMALASPLRKLVGDDKNKLDGLIKSLEKHIAALDGNLYGRGNDPIDLAYEAPSHGEALKKELDHLARELTAMGPEGRREAELAMHGANWELDRENPKRTSPDLETSWIRDCESYLELRSREWAERKTDEKATKPLFGGLTQRSRILLRELPPFLQDAMSALCRYRTAEGSYGSGYKIISGLPQKTDRLDNLIADLINNPIPGRILNAIGQDPEASRIYRDHLSSVTTSMVLGARRPDRPAVSDPLVQTFEGEKVPPEWSRAGITGGLKGFIDRLPKMSAAERETIRKWAVDQLVAQDRAEVEKLSKLSVGEILKSTSQGGPRCSIDYRGKLPENCPFGSELLSMMVSLIDESGDKETGVAGATLEQAKGGIPRFHPKAIAALNLKAEKEKSTPSFTPSVGRNGRDALKSAAEEAKTYLRMSGREPRPGEAFLTRLFNPGLQMQVENLDQLKPEERRSLATKMQESLLDFMFGDKLAPASLKSATPEQLRDYYREAVKSGRYPEGARHALGILVGTLDTLDEQKTALLAQGVSAATRGVQRLAGKGPTPQQDRLAELLTQLSSHGAGEPAKGLSTLARLQLGAQSSDQLGAAMKLKRDLHRTLDRQGFTDTDALWNRLVQTGSAEEVDSARQALTNNQVELEGLNAVNVSEYRKAIREEIARDGKLSAEGQRKLRLLASLAISPSRLAEQLRGALAANGGMGGDIRQTLANVNAIREAEIAAQMDPLEKSLREEVAMQEVAKLRATLRQEHAARLAKEQKKSPTDPGILSAAEDLATEQVARLSKYVLTSDDPKRTPTEDLPLVQKHLASLRQMSKVLGQNGVDETFRQLNRQIDVIAGDIRDNERALAEAKDPKTRQEIQTIIDDKKRFLEVFREDMPRGLGAIVRDLQADKSTPRTPHEIVEEAWKRAQSNGLYSDPKLHGQLVEAHREIVTRTTAENAARIKEINETSALDLCGTGGARFAALAKQAWTDWKELERRRIADLVSPKMRSQWQKLDEERQARAEINQGKRAALYARLDDLVAQRAMTAREIAQKEDFMTRKDSKWFDPKAFFVDAKKDYLRTLEAAKRYYGELQDQVRQVFNDRNDLEQIIAKEEEDLAHRQLMLANQMPSELTDAATSALPERNEYLRTLISKQGNGLSPDSQARLADFMDRYFEWRTRGETLGKVIGAEGSPSSFETRPQAFAQEGESCALGIKVDKAEGLKIVADAQGVEAKRATRRAEILKGLKEKYGITVSGFQPNFNHMHLPPNSGGRVDAGELEKLLTELGEYLPEPGIPNYLYETGLIKRPTPWDQLRASWLSTWNKPGRPAMFEWADAASAENATAPVRGLAIKPTAKIVDGKEVVTFELRDLAETQKLAGDAAKAFQAKVEGNVEDLHSLRAASGHTFQFLFGQYLGGGGTLPYHDAIATNLRVIQADIDRMNSFGNISTRLDPKKPPVPANLLGRHYGFEYQHAVKSAVENTQENIVNDAWWRDVTILASLAAIPLSGGTSLELGPLALEAQTVTEMIAGYRMAAGLHSFTNVLETDIMNPLGAPMRTFYSDRGPETLMSMALFGLSPLGGEAVGGIVNSRAVASLMKSMGGTSFKEALMAADAATATDFSTKLARFATSPSTTHLTGVFGTAFAFEGAKTAYNSNMYGYNFNLSDFLVTGGLKSAQTTFAMFGADQKLASAKFLQGFWPRYWASLAVNQAQSHAFAQYGISKTYEALDQQIAEAEKSKDSGQVAFLKKKKAEIDRWHTALETFGTEIGPHMLFANMAGKQGGIARITRELAETGMPAPGTNTYEGIKALADRQAQISNEWRVLGFKAGEAKQKITGDDVIAQALSQLPGYRIEAIRREAEANPASEARRVLAAFAEGQRMTPERLIQGLDAARNDPNYKGKYSPAKTLSSQLETVHRIAEERIDADFHTELSTSQGQMTPRADQLAVELVQINPGRYKDVSPDHILSPGRGQVRGTTSQKVVDAFAAANRYSPEVAQRFFDVYHPPAGRSSHTWADVDSYLRDSAGLQSPQAQVGLVKLKILSVDDIGYIWQGSPEIRFKAAERVVRDRNLSLPPNKQVDVDQFMQAFRAANQGDAHSPFEDFYTRLAP